MLLVDRAIRWAMAADEIAVDPFDRTLLQPASLDVRLDARFRVFNVFNDDVIDPATCQDERSTLVTAGSEGMILGPGAFILGCTVERVRLGDSIAARLEGKSSIGRLGLMVHSTAGFIDPGWDGQITLELANIRDRPIRLYPGMKIAQLCFLRCTGPAEHPYGSRRQLGSRYQDQDGPVTSRAWRDFLPAARDAEAGAPAPP